MYRVIEKVRYNHIPSMSRCLLYTVRVVCVSFQKAFTRKSILLYYVGLRNPLQTDKQTFFFEASKKAISSHI
jgi:hypothetical protein